MGYRDILEAAEPLTPKTRCGYCRFPYAKNPFGRLGFHAEHIVPKSKAPHLSMELSNLVWACLVCNINKHNFTEGHDYVTNTLVPLYHPKTQVWPIHFQGLANGKINGRSPTGRGTEARLAFNGEAIRVAARAALFSEGWWPAID